MLSVRCLANVTNDYKDEYSSELSSSTHAAGRAKRVENTRRCGNIPASPNVIGHDTASAAGESLLS